MNADLKDQPYPPRFVDLKREIAASFPDFEARITQAWKEVIGELIAFSDKVQQEGSNYIPQVNYSDLERLGAEEVDRIKRRGSVVIKDIVNDQKAIDWRESLREFVRVNPVEGIPADDKQFFQLYWTKAQVEARADPDLLKSTVWLNCLYHDRTEKKSGNVDLSIPLAYADRFRIRKAGVNWGVHPPHVDGGSIERWEDPCFRKCFENIFSGKWLDHDPYDLKGRLDARSSLYGRPNQATVFRTFQGWLSMSETAPTQGTLKVFPDVLLSNAYIMLRPFFKPLVPVESAEIIDAKNWSFDLESPQFPGIWAREGGWAGPRPTNISHPHLFLEKTMTSVPKVNPGDGVFWHCDVIHSVEEEHTGSEDSAVMYIPAVPWTDKNDDYVRRQKDAFLKGERPPDFPKGEGEAKFVGVATADDINNNLGRRAMGLPIAVA